jgi:hypothetical protein
VGVGNAWVVLPGVPVGWRGRIMTDIRYYCWRCNGEGVVYAKDDGAKWTCPVCDPNLLPDVYTARHRVNPVPPTCGDES